MNATAADQAILFLLGYWAAVCACMVLGVWRYAVKGSLSWVGFGICVFFLAVLAPCAGFYESMLPLFCVIGFASIFAWAMCSFLREHKP